MVFQSYALYPHLSVADNIAFGLRLRKTPKHVVEERVAWAARMLDLTPYLERRPKQLSGGQRQRVAMGRAIVREPKVFLMDEPLSNLDAKLRVQMRGEIAKLQHELGTTTIYVTHDQVEAMTMGAPGRRDAPRRPPADRPPQVLYDEPANLFVAGFIGTPPMNILAADVHVEGRRGHRRARRAAPPCPGLDARAVPGARQLQRPLRRDGDPQRGPPPDRTPARARPPHRAARAPRGARLRDGRRSSGSTRAPSRSGAGTSGDAVEEVVGEEGITAARPNLVATFPPRLDLRLGDDVEIGVDVEHAHFFDEETGAALR